MAHVVKAHVSSSEHGDASAIEIVAEAGALRLVETGRWCRVGFAGGFGLVVYIKVHFIVVGGQSDCWGR